MSLGDDVGVERQLAFEFLEDSLGIAPGVDLQREEKSLFDIGHFLIGNMVDLVCETRFVDRVDLFTHGNGLLGAGIDRYMGRTGPFAGTGGEIDDLDDTGRFVEGIVRDDESGAIGPDLSAYGLLRVRVFDIENVATTESIHRVESSFG